MKSFLNLGTSIPLFFPESGLMIRCFTEQPEGGFALDAQFNTEGERQSRTRLHSLSPQARTP
jgi:hypothetical protein